MRRSERACSATSPCAAILYNFVNNVYKNELFNIFAGAVVYIVMFIFIFKFVQV